MENLLPELAFRKAIPLAAAVLLTACFATVQTSNPGYDAKNAIAPDSRQLAFASEYLEDLQSYSLPGNNFISDIHDKDDKLLFFSSQRLAHENYQIYELDLKNKKERRITHQNGHAFQASYHPNHQHLIYASTTDFEKENLANLFDSDSIGKDGQLVLPDTSLRSDLYISRLNGTGIQRASFMDSAEQLPQYHPKDYTIVYRLVKESKSSIEAMTRARKPLQALSSRDGVKSFVRISKNGQKVVWLDWVDNKDFYLETMTWPQSPIERTKLEGLQEVRSLHWIDDQYLLLTARFDRDELPQIYSLKMDGSCLKKLASNALGIQSAVSQKDSFYFSAFTGQQWQLFSARLRASFSCDGPKTSNDESA